MAKCTSTPLWPLVSTAPNRYAEANNSHVVSVNHKEIVVYLTDSYTFAQESDPVLYRSFQKKSLRQLNKHLVGVCRRQPGHGSQSVKSTNANLQALRRDDTNKITRETERGSHLVTRERAVPGVAAGAGVLRELLLAPAKASGTPRGTHRHEQR